MANWGGAVGGAAQGASLGSSFGPYGTIIGGVGGGVLGLFSKKKKAPQAPEFQPYGGYRPPRVTHLRPVEDQITEILMQRSKGEGVGFDPERRNELSKNFEIQQDRDMEDTRSDLQNRISGMGLSRNPAVYDELLGRANREAGREKNLYENRIDIEDLARRNEERDVNTGRLQNMNTFNFGQENKAADFDLAVYGAENNARSGAFTDAMPYYEDQAGTGIANAADIYSILNDKGGGGFSSGMSQGQPTKSPTNRYDSSGDLGQNAFSKYLSQLSLSKSGKNFQR